MTSRRDQMKFARADGFSCSLWSTKLYAICASVCEAPWIGPGRQRTNGLASLQPLEGGRRRVRPRVELGPREVGGI
jgi:hypothetical protein